jgi:hypothetical protein
MFIMQHSATQYSIATVHTAQHHRRAWSMYYVLSTDQPWHASLVQTTQLLTKRMCRHVSAPSSEPNIDIAVV